MSELIKRNEWLKLTPREKVERLVGRSLDDIDEMLSIPLTACEPAMLNARVQVIRVILMTAAKLGIEDRRSRDWQAYLEELRAHERELEDKLQRAEKAKSAEQTRK